MKRCLAFLCAVLFPVPALAWGTTGHTIINRVAAATLPATVPAFLRTPEAIATIAYLGPEADRIKGAGESSDDDRNPGHYVDLDDAGTIAGVPLRDLPKDMEAYEKVLEANGTDPYRQGYLPYTIADGFELVSTDLAMWRAFDYLALHGAAADRATYAQWRDRRERLTIHDVGVWGHFVGDGSQPLHVSIHFNGWGEYPNPNNYTQAHVHAAFEGAFVRRYANAAAVERLVSGPTPDDSGELAFPQRLLTQSDIFAMIGAYLQATNARVPELYGIEKTNGFEYGTPIAVRFMTARLAAGAREMRDLIFVAWNNSAYARVGYPTIAVSDILSGAVTPHPSAFGGD